MATTTSTVRPDFTPPESIVAFVFIGVVALIGLILRCLALNHSTIRSTQSLDLMIYQAAPKAIGIQKPRRSSMDQQFESNSDNREPKTSPEDSVPPVRVQRGPKNL
jgi:hypothetical protein